MVNVRKPFCQTLITLSHACWFQQPLLLSNNCCYIFSLSCCLTERAKLTQDAREKLDEIRECVKIMSGNAGNNQDYVEFNQAYVLLRAIGLSPSDFEVNSSIPLLAFVVSRQLF